METRIGTCSLCGGDVIAWTGGWLSVCPPDPPRCSRCGARLGSDVIRMVPTPVPIVSRKDKRRTKN